LAEVQSKTSVTSVTSVTLDPIFGGNFDLKMIGK
jgi:hypothetical protein